MDEKMGKMFRSSSAKPNPCKISFIHFIAVFSILSILQRQHKVSWSPLPEPSQLDLKVHVFADCRLPPLCSTKTCSFCEAYDEYMAAEIWKAPTPPYQVWCSKKGFTCPAFFPHSMVNLAFFTQLLPLSVADVRDADVALIPLDFAAYFYKVAWHFHVPDPPQSPQDRDAFANERLCSWWKAAEGLFPDDSGTRYFIVWSYVFYKVDISCIPKHIYVLAYENVGHQGPPNEEEEDNGCATRCILIPYSTPHMFDSLHARQFPELDVNTSGFTHLVPFDYPVKSSKTHFTTRKCLLSWAGSLNRNPSMTRFRSVIPGLKAHYGTRFCDMSELVPDSELDVNREEINKLQLDSFFCLVLRGDTTTRVSFYSAVLSGCIPVIFESSLLVYEELFHGLLDIRAFTLVLPDAIWQHKLPPATAVSIIDEESQNLLGLEKKYLALKHASSHFMYTTSSGVALSGAVRSAIQAVAGRIVSKQQKDLVYIPQLPSKFNIDIISRGINISHGDVFKLKDENNASGSFDLAARLGNLGFGTHIQTSAHVSQLVPFKHSLRETSQYALELIIHGRLLEHPRRTVSIDRASIIVMPVYLFLHHWKRTSGVLNQDDAVDIFQEALKIAETYPKTIPKVWLFGDVLWGDFNDPQRRYFLEIFHLAGVDKPNVLPDNHYFFSLENDLNRTYSAIHYSNVIQLPFPTIVHRKRKFSAEELAFYDVSSRDHMRGKRRIHTICYVGRERWPTNIDTEGFIETSELVIRHLDLDGWKTVKDKEMFISFVSLYSKCDFVLCPYGDMGTRRSFYDAIMVGAIPLVFPTNAHIYRNMFSGDDVLKISEAVYEIPKDLHKVFSWKKLIKILQSITTTEIARKRRKIIDILPALQYSSIHDPTDALSRALERVLQLESAKTMTD